MADIELMTTRHSNDIITRLDKLEEQIVRKGVPKGTYMKKYIFDTAKVEIEGPMRILHLDVRFTEEYRDKTCIIDDYEFDVFYWERFMLYDERYFIDYYYPDAVVTNYTLYNDISEFHKNHKGGESKTHRGLFMKDMDVNYLKMSQKSYKLSGSLVYIPL